MYLWPEPSGGPHESNAQADEEPPYDYTPDACWKRGQFYYNPDDLALVVEKRFGYGYTFNFARWQTWALLAFILAVLLATILLIA